MEKIINQKKLKRTLEKQRGILLERLEKKTSLNGSDDIMNPDKEDRAITSRNSNMEILLLGHAEQQLQEIDHALNRLETGMYGICIACAKNIQLERLEIIPAAALCIECQRDQDN